MNVFMMCVEKITVAKNEVNNRIFALGNLCWITAKYIVNNATIVEPSWHFAVCIKAGITTRPCKSLDLITIRRVHDPKIGKRVATARFKGDSRLFEPLREPVLKVKFFVAAGTHSEFGICYCRVAG
jgi:hypothetical protein